MNYRVAVRSLCEFTAKTGDLDLRFTPAPSPEEGMHGHRVVQHRRPNYYEAEIDLKAHYPGLEVIGRADGYDPELNRLEEIKTHRSDIERIPDNHRALHRAQALIYGHMLCSQRGLKSLEVAVVYYHVITAEETTEPETFSAADLALFFNMHCERFLAWAEQETAHREARNQSLDVLEFPHATYRDGQRDLAKAVYRAVKHEHALLAQATTGIGKTLATIFPQLKAMPASNIDRLFFLTAKTPGRQLALGAFHTLREHHPLLRIRVLELVAREKACIYPDRACHGESCPLAEGFYDRLPDARAEAVKAAWLDQKRVSEIAQTHSICPYYLSQAIAPWADVCVGDYNYYFDMSAMLYALTVLNEWRITLLVDEAHNLIERGRGMYTVSLSQHALISAFDASPSALKRRLTDLNAVWHRRFRDFTNGYTALADVPDELIKALQVVVSHITDWLSDNRQMAPEILRFYFDALLFLRLAEQYGDHALCDIIIDDPKDPSTLNTVSIRNILPAHYLRPRFATAISSTLFSATLSPTDFYRDMLGMPDSTKAIDVDSPFSSAQLRVRIATNISTRYQNRAQSLPAVCELIAKQCAEQPGNYLAFFSSYDYLAAAEQHLAKCYPELCLRPQQRDMNEANRQAFVDSFGNDSEQLGLVVLGGAFGEGIDLPGKRLIGAFVTTLGMPSPTDINKIIETRMEAQFGSGFDYTYRFPGLQKVVQAAGRVIRDTNDTGVVYLLDDRYARPENLNLLPSWWQIEGV